MKFFAYLSGFPKTCNFSDRVIPHQLKEVFWCCHRIIFCLQIKPIKFTTLISNNHINLLIPGWFLNKKMVIFGVLVDTKFVWSKAQIISIDVNFWIFLCYNFIMFYLVSQIWNYKPWKCQWNCSIQTFSKPKMVLESKNWYG